MSERALHRRIVRALRQAGGHVQRIEDAISAGIPDINYCLPDGHEGWIEAKYVPRRPVRPTTPVRTCLTEAQALWLMDRWRAGGRAWLWVQVEREHLLIDGEDAGRVLAGLTWRELSSVARAAGVEDIVRALSI